MTYLLSDRLLLYQCPIRVLSHGVGLKWNFKEMADYSHNMCTTVAPMLAGLLLEVSGFVAW